MKRNTADEFLKSYEKNVDAIFRFSYIKTSDREVAKDITQETFLRVWDYLAKGGTISNLRAFLFKTARNMVIDHYRRPSSASLDSMMKDGFEPGTGGDRTRMDAEAEVSRILEFVGTLDEKHRDAVLLRYVEDMGVKDIAEVTGESAGAVSVRIHRAKKHIREHFSS